MQLEMVNKGAFFLKFKQPRHAQDTTSPAEEAEYLKGVQDYRTVEEKGFFVTKDIGCLLPHKQYGVRGEGSTLKGYQRASFFFSGVTPWRDTAVGRAKKGKPRKGPVLRDAHGWPTAAQLSHLCHRGSCMRCDHLQIEPQAVGLRRNFCGILGRGECDCGMQPPCLRKYSPTDWDDPTLEFCRTEDEVHAILAPLKATIPFDLLPREEIREAAHKKEHGKPPTRKPVACKRPSDASESGEPPPKRRC